MTARTVSARWLICAAVVVLALPSPDASRQPFQETVLGASLFRAAWGYRHDRAWLEAQLALLSRHRFNAIRALGIVGDPSEPDYWDGREIDWRWEDYDKVIAGLTDLAHDKYGLRVQWTIFADAQRNIPSEQDRAKLVERFIEMSRGRERKILAFEVANEAWQNGFGGANGVAQLRRFARRLREATDVPVAASAHREDLCGLYSAGAVDFATIHFDRNAPHAAWSPLTRPWRAERRRGAFSSCTLPETASNNEPLGPGSSVSSAPDPADVVMAAVNTWVAGLPIYMLHTGPGVRDDPGHETKLRPSSFDQLPNASELFAGLAKTRDYVPRDVFTWTPALPGAREFPFTLTARPPVALGALRGDAFIVSLAGIEGSVALTARRPMRVRTIEPLSGRTADEQHLARGQRLTLDRRAAVLVGTITRNAP